MLPIIVRLFAVIVVSLAAMRAALAGPIVPTRGFLVHPRWYGKTDTTSVFDHASYWAQVQRGFGSDSDRWAWTATMGAIFEFARWDGNKSFMGLTGTELTGDTHSDISFRPRGIVWTEGFMYAVHESDAFDWQLGMIYNCRHDVDNGDTGQFSDVGGQRTLIYCSVAGKAIWQSEKLLGLPIPTRSWLHADAYVIGQDYRLPRKDSNIGTNFTNIAWSFGEAVQFKLAEWERSSIYLMVNTDFTAFGNKTGFFARFGSPHITADTHSELGYTFGGRMGRLQLYAGYEQWEDDGQIPIPRNTQYALLGVRVTGSDLVSY